MISRLARLLLMIRLFPFFFVPFFDGLSATSAARFLGSFFSASASLLFGTGVLAKGFLFLPLLLKKRDSAKASDWSLSDSSPSESTVHSDGGETFWAVPCLCFCATRQISSSRESFSRISRSSSDISSDSLSGTWELWSMWHGLMDSLLPRISSISLKCFGMISSLSSLSLSDGTLPPLLYPVNWSLSLVFLYFFVKFANLFLHCCGVLSLSTFCSLHREWSLWSIDSHSGELKALYRSLSSFSPNSSTKIFSSVSVQRFLFWTIAATAAVAVLLQLRARQIRMGSYWRWVNFLRSLQLRAIERRHSILRLRVGREIRRAHSRILLLWILPGKNRKQINNLFHPDKKKVWVEWRGDVIHRLPFGLTAVIIQKCVLILFHFARAQNVAQRKPELRE